MKTELGKWHSGSAHASHRLCVRSRVQSPTYPRFCLFWGSRPIATKPRTTKTTSARETRDKSDEENVTYFCRNLLAVEIREIDLKLVAIVLRRMSREREKMKTGADRAELVVGGLLFAPRRL